MFQNNLEQMSYEQLLQVAQERYENHKKELSKKNSNAILISFMRFYAQANMLKDEQLCVDVLGCLHDSESSKLLAQAWLKAYPNEINAFFDKLKSNKNHFNQEFRKCIDKYHQNIIQLFSHNESDLSNQITNSPLSLHISPADSKSFEKKFQLIVDDYSKIKLEESLISLYEEIFKLKLNRLEISLQKFFDEKLEIAKIFMKKNLTTIQLLQAKISLLENYIRNGNFRSISNNKENTEPNNFCDEKYKELVLENKELEEEFVKLENQKNLISSLDKDKVAEYISLHREYEYMSNLAKTNHSNTSIFSEKSTSYNKQRFSSTPFNPTLNRYSLNFSSNSISFSIEDSAKDLSDIPQDIISSSTPCP